MQFRHFTIAVLSLTLFGNAFADENSFKLTVLSAENGKPMADVQVQIVMFGQGIRINQKLETDEKGQISMDYPPVVDTAGMWVEARSSGRVPYHISFSRQMRFDTLPTDKTIRMKKGVVLRGTIVDDKGQPVEGADVDMSVPATETIDDMHFGMHETTTKKDGRFVLDAVPETFQGMGISVNHPNFVTTRFDLKAGDETYALNPGFQVAGRVVDKATGKPVAKANVQSGEDRFGTSYPRTTTDENGEYLLRGLDDEATTITIDPLGKNLSPAFKQVAPSDANDENLARVDFDLEPGHTVRLKVVDPEGKPVGGAAVFADTWGQLRTLKFRTNTNAEGIAEWNGAPKEPVELHIIKRDFISVRDFKQPPREESYLVEFLPVTNLTALVTDKETGENIPEFIGKWGRKLKDREEIYWTDWRNAEGKNGLLTMRQNETSKDLYFRVDAEGYKPYISDAIDTKQGDHAVSVQLEKDKGIVGRVWLPNGKPAARARVIVVTNDSTDDFREGIPFEEETKLESPNAFTNIEGEFLLPTVAEKSLLLFIHELGHAEIPTDKLDFKPVKLQPWATLEVKVIYKAKPQQGKRVSYYPEKDYDNQHVSNYGLKAITDENGVAVINRVVPRNGWVNVARGTEPGNQTNESRKIEVKPGETTQITAGEGGCTVTGKIKLPKDFQSPKYKWDYVILRRRVGKKLSTFTGSFAKDHSFEYDALPPGKYNIDSALVLDNRMTRMGRGKPVLMVSHDFVIEEGKELVELGEIETKPVKQPNSAE